MIDLSQESGRTEGKSWVRGVMSRLRPAWGLSVEPTKNGNQKRPFRTQQELRHHYDIERSIAKRLLEADREGRAQIYRTMYDELFAEIPHHPRLVRREDPEQTRRSIQKKIALVKPFTNVACVFLEFGPGDCRFAFEFSKHVRKLYAVDISSQIGNAVPPNNVEIVLYNGYDLDLPEGTVDVVFSDQLIEHLHPEDTAFHFSLARKLLRPGGAYILTTPHALTGPHDVSRHFSNTAECFHLKEWTFDELVPLIRKSGFRSVAGYWFLRGKRLRIPLWAFSAVERKARKLPVTKRHSYLRYILPGVTIVAYT
ncbi:MAG TPA: class I SAM-dependent methyltransferase [Kiloniellales bacterium]